MSATLEQLKQKQTKLEQKLTELEALIKAYEEQEEAEFPKDGDEVYYINALGEVHKAYFNSEEDDGSLSIGNVFRTQEEAEFARERLKVIAEMKRCGGEFKYKRSTCRGEAFSFFIKYFNGEISVCSIDGFWAATKMRYPTEEAAQKAIDTIGEERLLRYWFCVEV